MKARIPSWLAQVVSLVLVLAGFGYMAAGVMYQIVAGGPLDLVFLSLYAAAFVAGLLLFLWDRQRQLSKPQPARLASSVLYFQMARAFLVLLVVAIVIAVVWSEDLQRTVIWWWLSVFTTAGLLGSLFSVWGYYKAGGGLGAWEFLAALVVRSRP